MSALGYDRGLSQTIEIEFRYLDLRCKHRNTLRSWTGR